MTPTTMALMCIGVNPIPATPFALRAADPPSIPPKKLDLASGRKVAHLKRMERVIGLLRESGPMSRAQIAKELHMKNYTVLNWLCLMRENGIVTAKKTGWIWYYEAVK